MGMIQWAVPWLENISHQMMPIIWKARAVILFSCPLDSGLLIMLWLSWEWDYIFVFSLVWTALIALFLSLSLV